MQYVFFKKAPIKKYSIIINKKYTNNNKVLKQQIMLELNNFINQNKNYFNKFKKIITYYDNGQKILGDAIDKAFSLLNEYEHIVDFDKTQERLFQVVDMLTFIDKFDFKYNKKSITKVDRFFVSIEEVRKIIKEINKKTFK